LLVILSNSFCEQALVELRDRDDLGPRALRSMSRQYALIRVADPVLSRGTCSRIGSTASALPMSTTSAPALEPPHDARDDLALAVLELVVDVVALGLANALVESPASRSARRSGRLLGRVLEIDQGAELLSCSRAASSSSER